MEAHDQAMLAAIGPLKEAGFALHWLHSKTKRPIGAEWSNAPVATADQLRRTHTAGNNLGVRLGEPSAMGAGGYLHTFDLDIRIADLADEAWEAFRELFPDVDPDSLPSVVSGSGGESRHRYFISDKPFFSKKLAVSEGKHRGRDGKWHYDWEIELFGTGKQVVLPPSIHPDTGAPYRWEREFDFDMLALGAGPFIPSAAIERLAEAVAERYEFESRDPLTFEPGELERDLDSVPVDRIDDYHDWIALGQALHHQFGGATEGYDLWFKHSQRSEKFDGKDMLRKWRGFGRSRRQPVTMGTIRQWALDARRAEAIASIHDAFDEEDDEPEDSDDAALDDLSPAELAEAIDIAALLGEPAPATAEEIDEIDAIGSVAVTAAVLSAELDWMSLLDIDADKGAIRATLHNVELIVKNDPRLVGLPQLNEFTQETVQRTAPGTKAPRRRNPAKATRQLTGRVWRVDDPQNGDLWSDDRDFAIRSVLEAPKTQGGYGLKVPDRDLRAAIVLAANDHPFHPIREYLDGLTWDGTERVERLWIDHVGAPDDRYHRDVARLALVAAVARIYEPGHKFDFATILEGLQGKGKSSLIQALGRNWFAELDGDFHDPKQMVELMQGAWIMEIPELTGFSRADVRAIKAFISRQKDRVRLAYARRAGSFPRQVIFIGSTNDREYLKDDTGGRRFWPVVCSLKEIDIPRLEAEVDQLWAEATALYREMRAKQPHGRLPLYLAHADARVIAARLQESRRVESADDGVAGRIAAWLDLPVNNGGLDDEPGGSKRRDKTCLMQIFVEALGGDLRNYDQSKSQTIGRAMGRVPGWRKGECDAVTFPQPYGRQRPYFREGSDDDLAKLGL